MRAVIALLALLVLSACSTAAPGKSTGPRTGTIEYTIEYTMGSVAPPHHYSWRIDVGANTATLAWTPGYDDVDPWTTTVDISAQDRERLYRRLDASGLFDVKDDETDDDTDEDIVGGPTGRVTVDGTFDSGTLGTSRAGQDLLDEVKAAAEELLPAEVWREMADKQEEWAK